MREPATNTRARRDLKALHSQTFRRQRRQAREAVKREVARLLAEHEDQRRQFRFPPLSAEQREAVIEGFRQRVAVPSNDGSMPWSDIEVLQDRVRETEDCPGASASRFPRRADETRALIVTYRLLIYAALSLCIFLRFGGFIWPSVRQNTPCCRSQRVIRSAGDVWKQWMSSRGPRPFPRYDR